MFGEEQRRRTRDALLKLAEYVEKGFIHPEFVTFDDASYYEEVLSDRAGGLFDNLWGAY